MKILALDIETMFITAGVWSLWDQNVGLNQILDSGGLICYAAKWLGSREMFFAKKGDKNFLPDLHKLLSEADAILSYNGERFDVKKINKAFLVAGMKPPPPYKHIDLFKTIKRHFAFESNKLQYISAQLGIGSKTSHEGFPLWIKCSQGDEKAWKKMEAYNKNDVKLLEKLYYKIQGWVSNHPSRSLEEEDHCCPNCGSDDLQRRGNYKTKVSVYARWACKSCGSWSRSRVSEVAPDNRQNILVSI